MAECRFLLPLAFSIDLGSVFVSRLGKVEKIPGRVVRAVACERPIAWPLHDFDIGVFLQNLLPDLFEALDFDAEMVKSCFAPCSPRDERHPDIPVADRDCADLAHGVARRLQPEHCAVEHSEQRVAITRNGQMIELAEHSSLPGSTPTVNR